MLLSAISFAVLSTTGAKDATCSTDAGYDYAGFDIVPRVYHTVLDVAACCAACHNDTRCNFFGFMAGKEHGNENCWLKTSDKGRKRGDRISGSVGRVPPSPPSPSPSPSPHPHPHPSPPSPPAPDGGVHRACTGDNAHYPFCNTSLTIAARVKDLVSRIKNPDKPTLMTARHSSPIAYLGVPAYDWGVNSIHGDQVSCGTNCATNYPLPVAIGASFNMTLVEDLARMMGMELRALRLEQSCEKHISVAAADGGGGGGGDSGPPDACIGLDTWAPNLNINRDPRWGRNWEVASEDPYLTGQIGKAYAQGFQTSKEDPDHLLGVITIKHWAAYTVEKNRGGYDDRVHMYDMADTYLPAFRTAVREGNAAGIMCSYNAINGVPTCASKQLNQILRDTWKFDGYVTSDTGAIRDIFNAHGYCKTPENATSLALQAGCDINSGSVYATAAGKGVLNPISPLYNVSLVDLALSHAFAVRMRLGLFDPVANQPFERFGPETVGSAAHHALSADASRQGITLLSNTRLGGKASTLAKGRAAAAGQVLPLAKGKRLLVVGPNADTKSMMAGGTGGGLLSATVVCKCATSATDWCCLLSPVEAINASNSDGGAKGSVTLLPGCSINGAHSDKANIEAAVEAAKGADAVVFVIGGDWSVEHEAMDRSDISLPGMQSTLVESVAAAVGAAVPVVSVMVHGGSMDIARVLNASHGVIDASYPGVHGAQAIADVIFGDHNPGGKTPYTWYRSEYVSKVSMDNFDMAKPPGRSYRYLEQDSSDVLIPFAFGLSYTTFDLSASSSMNAPEGLPQQVLSNNASTNTVAFSVVVKNTGSVAGTETVFGYWSPPAAANVNPVDPSYMKLQKQLFDFSKVALAAGESKTVTLSLSVDQLVRIGADGGRVSTPGVYPIAIDRGATTAPVTAGVDLQGSVRVLESLPAGL